MGCGDKDKRHIVGVDALSKTFCWPYSLVLMHYSRMGKNRKNDSDSRFDVAKDECKKDSIVVTLTADAFGVDVEKKNSYG